MSDYYDFDGNPLSEAYSYDGELIYVAKKIYPFSDYIDVSSYDFLSETNEHIKKSETGVRIDLDGSGSKTFDLSVDPIKTHYDAFGFWVYCDYNQKDTYKLYLTITVNGRYNVALTPMQTGSIRAGRIYYMCTDSRNIDEIRTVSISANGDAGAWCVLDAIEVGYKAEMPTILLNFDSVGSRFYTPAFDLFKQYGLTATFDYHVSADEFDGLPDAWDVAEIGYSKEMHDEMLQYGMDFGIYSGIKSWEKKYGLQTASTGGTPTNYKTDYDEWQIHADAMVRTGSSVGINHPSTVHSTGHKLGEAYLKAMAERFLLVRGDMIGPSSSNTNAFFVNIDMDEYRHIIPVYVANAFGRDSATLATLKNMINNAILCKANMMIMFHTVEPIGYTPDSGDMNVGYEFMDELLKFLKSRVDIYKCRVMTSKDFIADQYPEAYEDWSQ